MKAVLIDFRYTGVRQDGESREEWIRNVEFLDDEDPRQHSGTQEFIYTKLMTNNTM